MNDIDDLIYDVRDGIGLITLNRPAARNALTFEMYGELKRICETVDQDVRALVITGAGGKAFAAGTDISCFRAFSKPDDASTYERRMDEVLSALEQCRVPTIAAINGACTGGGAAIAACCDLRIGAHDLRFGFPIARTLGNCLSNASLSRLTVLIGAARTKELIFTARLIGAREALALGLVSEVADETEQVLERALALARTVAGFAPLTLRATKEALRRARLRQTGADDEDLIEMCYMSEDFREGMEAFLAKRKPRWQGR